MHGFKIILSQTSPGGWEVIIALILFLGFVLMMRLVGAWMLRINEVIGLLRAIRDILNQKNSPN